MSLEIYAGGAIDYTDNGHQWRHDLEGYIGVRDRFLVYCPICANKNSYTAAAAADLMARNEAALLRADICVFLLDGTFTVGTPVEIYMRLQAKGPAGILIVHANGAPGMFVAAWEAAGVAVVESWEEAAQWLDELESEDV